MNVYLALVATAGILAIISLIKPAWPLLGVAVLLVCIALFIGKMS